MKTEQFPKLGAGQYGAELSAILVENPDLVHSSFWGGDMEALVLQGARAGSSTTARWSYICGETGMFRLARADAGRCDHRRRGPYGVFAPDNPLNAWFRKDTKRPTTPADLSHLQDGPGDPGAEDARRESGQRTR